MRIAARFSPSILSLTEPVHRHVRGPQSFAEFRDAFAGHLQPFRLWFNFRCNSLGFHDAEFHPTLPPGTVRLVVLGDSFAYGNVPYNDAYLTVAEARLVAYAVAELHRPPPAVELDNLGVPASGIDDYRIVYKFIGRPLHPDVVVVNLYMGNDLHELSDWARFGATRAHRLRPKLFTLLANGTRLIRERLAGNDLLAAPVADPSGPGGVIVESEQTYSDDQPPLSTPTFSDQAFADIMEVELHELTREPRGGPAFERALSRALDDLVGAISIDGHRVILALSPSRLQIYPAELEAAIARSREPAATFDPDAPRRWLTRYAQSRHLRLIDTTDRLREAAARGARLYHPNDTHWNIQGNHVAGDELAHQLIALGALNP